MQSLSTAPWGTDNQRNPDGRALTTTTFVLELYLYEATRTKRRDQRNATHVHEEEEEVKSLFIRAPSTSRH